MTPKKDFNWKRYGKAGKGICPQCKHKSLVRYRNKITGEISDDTRFGCCDRLYSCGFQKAPPEKDLPLEAAPVFVEPPIQISYTDESAVRRSIKSPTNNLFKYCAARFGLLRTRQVFAEYLTGDSLKKKGACTFWFKDIEGKIRGGMICEYTEKGKRRRDTVNVWEHEKGYNFVLSNFGEHLIPKYPKKEIGVVEAPKTVLIASLKYPDKLWIGTNGLTTLQEGRCESFRGRDVVLYPDREPEEFPENARWLKGYWKKKGDILRGICHSLTVFEGLDLSPEGTDIADLI